MFNADTNLQLKGRKPFDPSEYWLLFRADINRSPSEVCVNLVTSLLLPEVQETRMFLIAPQASRPEMKRASG